MSFRVFPKSSRVGVFFHGKMNQITQVININYRKGSLRDRSGKSPRAARQRDMGGSANLHEGGTGEGMVLGSPAARLERNATELISLHA